MMSIGDGASWAKDIRFKALLEALQEAINQNAAQKAKYPLDHPELMRGKIDGLIRGKQLAGYHSQIYVQEMLEVKAAGMRDAKADLRWAASGHDWERDPDFRPLLEAIQEEANRNESERTKFPQDHPEYMRGFGLGLERARQLSGYHSQLNVQMAEAEARLARGEVRSGQEVRAEQSARFGGDAPAINN
jgi:hypothetical protein